MKPNLFIVGAPKCGTTSLSNWLSGHSEVFFSPVKEPHYFNKKGLGAIKSLSDYEALFKEAGAEKIVAEASTHYLFSKDAIPNIKKYQPEAKFIVCLRSPIAMAKSLHAERLSQGRENIKSFSRAWALQEERKAGRYIPLTLKEDPDRLQYGAYCKLGEQVDRLLKEVSIDQVKLVFLDDLIASPEAEGKEILKFLGVDPNYSEPFPFANPAKSTRYPGLLSVMRYLSQMKNRVGLRKSTGWYGSLKNNFVFEGTKEELDLSLKNEMLEFFKDDISLLSKTANRDLSHWLE